MSSIETVKCYFCSAVRPHDQMRHFFRINSRGERARSHSCRSHSGFPYTVLCDRCERIWKRENTGETWRGEIICDEEEGYTTCHGCCKFVSNDECISVDGEDYCPDCVPQEEDGEDEPPEKEELPPVSFRSDIESLLNDRESEI